MVVKLINTLKREKPPAPAEPPPPSKEQVLLAEIRDLLAKRS
jgi:large conductance mechanosensitive channel